MPRTEVLKKKKELVFSVIVLGPVARKKEVFSEPS